MSINLPSIIEKGIVKPVRPVKVLQFGEGNFLRAFVDYMFDILNEKCGFDGSIAIVKPINFGDSSGFDEQNSIYTVLLRGLVDGEKKTETRIVNSVEKVISCYDNYDEYMGYAKLESLRYIVSNTTEAGIVLNKEDKLEMNPPASYPAKLTKFLYERYNHFAGDQSKGLVILPVELIDDNGIELKRIVLELASIWQLEDEFVSWMNNACIFTSTLVDRIVTGYPREDIDDVFAQLGYTDKIIVAGEPFALWVIESDKDLSSELKFAEAGLPVVFTDNQKPYKQRKVRILNGAHTSFVLSAYLSGFDYVGESLEDENIMKFMTSVIYDEVIPTLDLPKDDLLSFADAVIDRFKNPFIKHSLLAISLNSVSKWKARCLPSFKVYVEQNNAVPKSLAFSLASLIAFYNGFELRDNALIGKRGEGEYKIQDDAFVLDFFNNNKDLSADDIAKAVLSNVNFFGEDLSAVLDTNELVSGYLKDIKENGIKSALNKFLN